MDKVTIIRKYSYLLERFDKSKEYLKSYHSLDKEKREVYFDALERSIEEVLETCIKLNIFILKEKNIFPKTYLESFSLMNEFLDFDDEMKKELEYLARFRNILAYEYMDMKEDLTIEKIEKILNILPEYIKRVKAFLK